MSSSSTSRLAEHLVCAELARRNPNLFATTFTHNIPEFDILVADGKGHSIPIQVKATNSESWRTSATTWMQITFDEPQQTQSIGACTALNIPNLIWVCVAVATKYGQDRFFILTASDIQKICIESHREVLEKFAGHRPRNWESVDCWWNTDDLKPFEDRWELISERINVDHAQ